MYWHVLAVKKQENWIRRVKLSNNGCFGSCWHQQMTCSKTCYVLDWWSQIKPVLFFLWSIIVLWKEGAVNSYERHTPSRSGSPLFLCPSFSSLSHLTSIKPINLINIPHPGANQAFSFEKRGQSSVLSWGKHIDILSSQSVCAALFHWTGFILKWCRKEDFPLLYSHYFFSWIVFKIPHILCSCEI